MTKNELFHIGAKVLLTCVLLSGCTAASAKVGQPTAAATLIQPTATLFVSDALRQDAEMMAADLDISVDEAIRRLSLQDPIGFLNAQLEEQEAETFAGLWIQNEPDYHVVVAFTRDGEKTIEPYIKNTSLEGLVEVRTAEVSLAELKAIHQDVIEMVRDLGFSFSSGIKLQDGLVQLYVTDQALWEAALQQAGLQLPERVEVIVTYVPLGDDLPFALTPVSGIFLPQLRVQSGAFMLALLRGTLVVEDGCLRVDAGSEGGSRLIIWQPDYFLNDNNGQIEVLDRDGQVVARVGDSIELGGGEVPLPSSSHLREPVPSQCKGPYWLMGQISARE